MRNSDKAIARRMPCSTPTKTTTTAVVTASANSPGLSRRMALRAAQIDKAHGDGEHNRSKNTLRKKLQRTGEEKKDQSNDASGGQVRQLVCAAGTFDHGGLCGAAIHNKGAAESRGGIGGREADKVGVLVELLMMASGICARCCGALRNDHDKTRAGDRKQRFHVSPTQIGQTQMRQAAGHRAENGDARLRPVKDGARRDCPGNRKERTGQLGGKAVEEEDSRLQPRMKSPS